MIHRNAFRASFSPLHLIRLPSRHYSTLYILMSDMRQRTVPNSSSGSESSSDAQAKITSKNVETIPEKRGNSGDRHDHDSDEEHDHDHPIDEEKRKFTPFISTAFNSQIGRELRNWWLNGYPSAELIHQSITYYGKYPNSAFQSASSSTSQSTYVTDTNFINGFHVPQLLSILPDPTPIPTNLTQPIHPY